MNSVFGARAAVLAALLLCFAVGAVEPGARITVASADTAIQVEAGADTLSIAALKCPDTGYDWVRSKTALPFIRTAEQDGQATPLRWQFKRSESPDGPPRRQVLVFANAEPPLELHSIWQAEPGPGPVEHSIAIKNTGRAPVLLPLQKSLVFTAQAAPGRTLEHWWVEKGANTPTAAGTHRQAVKPGFEASLVSRPYARETPREGIPWSSVQDVEGREGFYVGVEFSGIVRIAMRAAALPPSPSPPREGVGGGGADRQTAPALEVSLGLGSDNAQEEASFRTRLSPGETFEAPAVFVGCYKGEVDDGANRLRRWVQSHLRPPSPGCELPLLTNNSWGSGMAVDAQLARRMIVSSAAMGMELYHIDAGWFRGVGDWHPEARKFPEGLGPIAEYAHGQGLRFGLWIGWTQGGHQRGEGGKDSILSVFDPAMKPWFTRDYAEQWRNSAFTGADVCLGEPQAEEWCLRELRRSDKEYKLGLLEHDQRMLVDACRRENHRHTSSPLDVAFQAARAYYRIYDTLRAENPELLFENCVNGGHMVDYGVVRRTHYISITDTYDPISNRRAFHDSSYALPPAMCECYVANHPGKSLANFNYMLRSGMLGWCTIMLDMNAWTAEQNASAKKQFDLYKQRLRPLIAHGNLYHVSERPDGKRWDGMLYVDPKGAGGVLFAFRAKNEEASHVFKLKGLEAAARFKLTFEDGSSQPLTLTGDELMQQGLTVRLPQTDSSELVFLTRE